MWHELVTAVQLRRAIWVQEVQPALVAGDPFVAVIRVGIMVTSITVLDWSYVREVGKVPTVAAHFWAFVLLSLIRFYYSRYHPVQYGQWRWLMILVMDINAVSSHIQVTPLFPSPAHTLQDYLRNLLLHSGVFVTTLNPILEREMFYVTCPFLGLAVGVLCYNADKVCHVGLLATGYGAQTTRTMFQYVGRVINILATVVRPFEHDPLFGSDPLVAVPGPPDPTKDLPYCMCLVRSLLVSFTFLLPTVVLFLHEDRVIRRGMRLRGQQWPRADPRPVAPERGIIDFLMTSIVVIMLGGTWTWAALRWYLDV